MPADLFLCNAALRKVVPESEQWDYWVACLNPMCEHGMGEGYFQSLPEWVKKPWQVPVIFWGVFEREPRMCAEPDSIVMGQYQSEQEAETARERYFGTDPNYYVASFTYKNGKTTKTEITETTGS
jgi:hypothetical protein